MFCFGPCPTVHRTYIELWDHRALRAGLGRNKEECWELILGQSHKRQAPYLLYNISTPKAEFLFFFLPENRKFIKKWKRRY